MKTTQLPDQEREMIPEGQYTLGVKGIEKKVGKNSGTAYLSVEYVITDGEFKGRHVFDNMSLSPKSLWMLKKWLIALGLGEIDLPIEVGADKQFVVDEDGCALAISQSAKGCEVLADITITPENKEKGWPEKNEVSNYVEMPNFRERWDE